VSHLLKTSWQKYLKGVEQADCQATLNRLIAGQREIVFWGVDCALSVVVCPGGPPINLVDATGLPCPPAGSSDPASESGAVHQFWHESDGKEHSAKLEGSLTGEARMAWWSERKVFMQDSSAPAAEAAAVAVPNAVSAQSDQKQDPVVSGQQKHGSSQGVISVD
jgi:hypothetical protein